MKFFTLVVIALCLFVSAKKLPFTPLEAISPHDLLVLKCLETDDCMIQWIGARNEGPAYLVKQIKDTNPDEQFLLVLDTLGCYIARESSIPMNQVALIPASQSFPGKYYPDRMATLHTLAPGVSVSEQLPWEDFDIHQRFRKPGTALWHKWGPLPQHREGLTREVIAHMARHADLPSIVALDTFVGNADRSLPNIFYDAANDSFCGIDMAASFNSPLVRSACRQLRGLKQENRLSPQEKQALWQYEETLRKLRELFPLEKLEMLLDAFCEQVSFVLGDPSFSKDLVDRIAHHKQMMKDNDSDLDALLILLSEMRDVSQTARTFGPAFVKPTPVKGYCKSTWKIHYGL